MARTSPLAPESLLAHDDFVRRLARQLLRDASAADDVGQQAWLAVLQRPAGAGGEPQSWRAFLATLVRRLCRRQQRRERREQARRAVVAAAHDGASPSVAALHVREAQRARVVQAVLALPDPYREVVVLRWFEDLPPRAIARRLALPVETVRTRHKRALAQLARTLDGEAGDRAAWAAPLVALAPPDAAGPAGFWSLPGVLLMSLQTKLVALLFVVGALLCLAWPLWTSPPDGTTAAPTAPPANATAAAANGPDGGAVAAAPSSATSAAEERIPAPGAAPDALTASLQVTVRYADEQPAAGLQVSVRRSGDDEGRTTSPPSGRTDDHGVVQFHELAPGRVFATVFRGQTRWGDGVVLPPGRRTDLVVQLERGMDLRGIVVDDQGRPVVGAVIVVGDWTGSEAEELGVTAADGTFSLRAIATHCHVGARGAGFAPSPLRQFTTNDGATVETRIVLEHPGVALHGVVVDVAGNPVGGAEVRVGDPEQSGVTLPDGAQAMAWRPESTRSDERGSFAFLHLPAERMPLAVKALGHAPTRQEVDLLAGRDHQVRVVLSRGAALRGRVCDAAGQPVSGAAIQIGEWPDVGHRRVRTSKDGTFALDDLRSGDIEAMAESETQGRAKATLTLIAGVVTTWEPRLSVGRTLRGKVVAADGAPLAGVHVQGTAPGGGGGPWWAFERSDSEGRFELKDCPDRPLRLELLRRGSFPELVTDDVLVSSDELVLTMPNEAWVHIAGTILDPDGAPVANVHIAPSKAGGHSSPAETADADTGAFRLGPYPPGRYALRLSCGGFVPITRTQDVAGDSTWELGELRFQRGGYVELAPQLQDLQADDVYFTAIADADGSRESFAAQGGAPRAGPLAAGSYRLVAWGEQVGAVSQPFTVVADRTTTVDVPLTRGLRIPLLAVRAAAATGAPPASAIVEFTVVDANGRELGRPSAYWQDGEATGTFGFLPGRYTITAVAFDRHAAPTAAGAPWQGSAVLEVPAAGVAGAPTGLRVELAPR